MEGGFQNRGFCTMNREIFDLSKPLNLSDIGDSDVWFDNSVRAVVSKDYVEKEVTGTVCDIFGQSGNIHIRFRTKNWIYDFAAEEQIEFHPKEKILLHQVSYMFIGDKKYLSMGTQKQKKERRSLEVALSGKTNFQRHGFQVNNLENKENIHIMLHCTYGISF